MNEAATEIVLVGDWLAAEELQDLTLSESFVSDHF
jgi:hypothetical protein